MKKLIVFLVVVAAIVTAIAQVVLPTFVSHQMESLLGDKLHAESRYVDIQSSPAIKMASGQIDSFVGEFENAKLGKLNFAEVRVHVNHASVDPIQLIISQRVVLTGLGTGEIEGTITSQDLESFMESSVKGLGNARVTVHDDTIELTGNIDVGGFLRGKATIAGVLAIKENQLYFVPQRFAINGINVGGLNSALLKDVALYNFSNFPIAAQAERVVLENGEIHVFVTPGAN